jgi:Phosphate-selective porin O and P
MKDKTVMHIQHNHLVTGSQGSHFLWVAIVLFWSVSASCQEFNAIIKELNNLESKLTRLVQNEASQRKASDSTIIKSIGKGSVAQSPASDSAIYAEINHIKILVTANSVKTDSVVKSLIALQCRVDSLVNNQPDQRVVELATMLQQIVNDLKKELAIKTEPVVSKPPTEEKKAPESFKPKTDIGGLIYAQYSYDASKNPSIDNDGFSIERAYLDLKAQVLQNISGRITLDLDQKATTAKYVFIKYAYADYTLFDNTLTIRAGQQETPWIGFVDKAWKYRSIEKNLSDYNKILSSADIGAGAIIKLPRNYGELVTQIINGNGFKNVSGMEENNFQKDFAARLSINPMPASVWGKELSASIGFQYKNSSNAPSAVTTGLVAYENNLFSAGIEGLGATKRDSVNKVVSLRTVGYSLFGDVSMPFYPNAGVLARYDSWDPDNTVSEDGSSLVIAGARYRITAKHIVSVVYEESGKQKSGSVPVKLVKVVLEAKF